MQHIISVLESCGAHQHHYEKNEYLLEQSVAVSSLLFCLNANLTISYINSNGNEFILKIEENYTGFIGEMEFFQKDNHSLFSVRSNQPGSYYKLTKPQVLKVLSANQTVFSDLMNLMTQRYNTNVRKLIETLTQPTRTSIENQILQAHNLSGQDYFEMSSTLNSKKLGITPRTYRRIIHDLIDEGILEKTGRRYKLVGNL
ncbi:Crp/Fnr family transcriptional regulator [Vibrio sp. J1-1]|uniref:Crp/Fnr family transcriptional regulator n=1 Tax=Vibrio sp. J1-1 TaxID=2912251 RepID=UPI001D1A9BAD|nr:Crp/Fnr family transcriptional regulator [Vibrio sp. J1-1]MBR9786970.1 Crp/Fnr family transcriptional regulator [Vibrionaceae bacterium]MCF7481799.1 Crp/Fnr family transcriptional regulator [Vibrio sp. J1-1]